MPASMASGPLTSSPASRTPDQAADVLATLPLSPRAASLLAWSAGWLSGWLVLTLEGRRLEVRRHAAQALCGFGALTLLGAGLLAMAGVSLFVSIAVFRGLLWLVQGVIAVGVVCWVIALVQAARGRQVHWPLVGRLAERLAAAPHASRR